MDSAPQVSINRESRQHPSLLSQTSAKPNVLLVEDHDDTREMLSIFLEYYGCHVVEARSGEQAISVAERDTPHLILLDMKLPGLDGLAVARLLRSRPELGSIPIIAMTADAQPDFRVQVLQGGCNYLVVKPFDFTRLEELVKSLVRPKVQHSVGVLNTVSVLV